MRNVFALAVLLGQGLRSAQGARIPSPRRVNCDSVGNLRKFKETARHFTGRQG